MDPEQFKSAFGRIEFGKDEKGEYPYFVPEALPPKIEYDAEMIGLMSSADRSIGELSGIGMTLLNPSLLIMPYMKKEAVLSSKIEGTRISLPELFLSEATDRETKDSKEVLNYVYAMQFALDRIGEGARIDGNLIREMHRILMRGVRGNERNPGKYRQVQNWIGEAGTPREKAAFVPPHHSLVEGLMGDLSKYIEADDGMPALVKAALIHYQFETIHPFADGNGRLGRALITLYLCKKGLLSKPLLYMSGFFEPNKSEYYALLLKANREGDFRGWARFFLRAVDAQASDAISKSRKLRDLREKYIEKSSGLSTKKVPNAIDMMFVNPFMQVRSVERGLEVSYPTAKKIVAELEKAGMLKSGKERKRNNVYVAHEVLDAIDI